MPTPVTDEGGELAVAAAVTVGLDLGKENLDGTAVLFGTVGVDFEGLFECGVKFGQFAGTLGPVVGGRRLLRRRSQPSAYRVAR